MPSFLANVCEEKPEALGLPNKGALCRRGHGHGHHHRRTEQSWPGFPQSLSLVLYNLIMFPFRGLSRSSSSECQAASVRHGLVVDCSGRRGALGLLGKQSSQGLSWGARSGLQAERNSPAWERVGAAIARRWGSSCAPGSNSLHTRRGLTLLSSRAEGLLFLHGLESNPGSSLQTEEEAGLP